MKDGKLPMWQDPDESPVVRRLIRAGRVAESDYDVERGLTRYLANLQAGAPAPMLAAEAAQKATLSSLLGWLLPPIISVVALGGWTFLHRDQANAPVLRAGAGAVAGAELVPSHATEPLPALAAVPSTGLAAHQRDLGSDADALARAGRLDETASARNLRADRLEQSDRNSERPYLHREELAATGARSYGYGSGKGTWNSGALRPGATSYRRSGAGVDRADRAERTGKSSSATRAPSAALAPHADLPQQAATREEAARVASADAAPAQTPASTSPDPKAKASAEGAQRPQPAVVAESDSRLEREMQMLAVAQRILAADPARALRLTRQGDHEFPGTMFAAERKQLGLLALVKLGRLAEARQKGATFLRAYPNAPWTARLREALSTGQVPAL